MTLKGLLSSGVKMGLSTRSTGSVHPIKEGHLTNAEGGPLMAVKNMRLISIDAVHDPACSESAIKSITESMQYSLPQISYHDYLLEQTRGFISQMGRYCR
jgi:hypothetical protein